MHIGDLTYGYDAAGRPTSLGGSLASVNLPPALSSAVYNPNNQLTQWGSTNLSYDLDGNLTNDGVRSYVWNARNQLVGFGGPGISYDGLGRRTQNLAGTSFLYDGANVVQELSGASVTANFLTGLAMDEIFARTDSVGTRSFLTDGLGSTLALADFAGVLQTFYTYEPFGNVTVSGYANGNTFQYAGRENDGSGLYYYRARYYQPQLQRFISEDPLDFNGGDWNLYAYVANDPILYVDPYGLQEFFGPLVDGTMASRTSGFTIAPWMEQMKGQYREMAPRPGSFRPTPPFIPREGGPIPEPNYYPPNQFNPPNPFSPPDGPPPSPGPDWPHNWNPWNPCCGNPYALPGPGFPNSSPVPTIPGNPPSGGRKDPPTTPCTSPWGCV